MPRTLGGRSFSSDKNRCYRSTPVILSGASRFFLPRRFVARPRLASRRIPLRLLKSAHSSGGLFTQPRPLSFSSEAKNLNLSARENVSMIIPRRPPLGLALPGHRPPRPRYQSLDRLTNHRILASRNNPQLPLPRPQPQSRHSLQSVRQLQLTHLAYRPHRRCHCRHRRNCLAARQRHKSQYPQRRRPRAPFLAAPPGNVTDRILHGAVTDFIEVFLGSYRWPAFNIADSASP